MELFFVVISIFLFGFLFFLWTSQEIWKLVWLIMVIWGIVIAWQDHHEWRLNQIKIEADRIVSEQYFSQTNSISE